jgi:hypothetical protein
MAIPGRRNMIEKLAEYAHNTWSKWMKHLFSQCVPQPDGSLIIPPDHVEHWKRQMNTSYEGLTGIEKISDRKEAEKILSILGSGEEND